MTRQIALVLVSLVLVSCQSWGPTWSEVTGERYSYATHNRRAAIIERVDDATTFPGIPVRIEPGRHTLALQAPDVRWLQSGRLRTMDLVAEPCQRYYVNAQFASAAGPEWQPVVDHVEPIAGCRRPVAR